MKRYFLTIIPVFILLLLPFGCSNVKSDSGLFISQDKGENWQELTIKEGEKNISLDVLTINIDPKNSDIIYIGARENGIYKTESSGKDWLKLTDKNGLLDSRANIYDIAIDPKETNRIYVAVYQDRKGRVFRSQDSGNSWEEVYIVSEEKYAIFAVAVDSYEPNVVYIGTAQGGFLKSTDYGKSWETMKWFDDIISDIVINPKNTRIVYLSTFSRGIYKTTNKGETWQSFEEKMREFSQAQNVERLVIDLQRPDIIYAGSDYGLLATKDGGKTWQEVNIIMPPQSLPILSLAINQQNTDYLYYGAGSMLYRSLDQGQNWTVYELPSSRTIKFIAIDPFRPDLIYAGMHE